MKQWPKMDAVPPLGDTETAKEAARLIAQVNQAGWAEKPDSERLLILEQGMTAIHRLLWIVGLYRSVRRKLKTQKKCGPRKRLLKTFGIKIENEKETVGKGKV